MNNLCFELIFTFISNHVKHLTLLIMLYFSLEYKKRWATYSEN